MPIKGVVIMQQLGTKTSYSTLSPWAIDAAGKKPLILLWRWGGYLRPGGGAAGKIKKPLTLKQAKRCFLASKHHQQRLALPVKAEGLKSQMKFSVS